MCILSAIVYSHYYIISTYFREFHTIFMFLLFKAQEIFTKSLLKCVSFKNNFSSVLCILHASSITISLIHLLEQTAGKGTDYV